MARIDNLTNFLTDVANSIRSKTGKTDAIPAENFDTEIESISGGGGDTGVMEGEFTPSDSDGDLYKIDLPEGKTLKTLIVSSKTLNTTTRDNYTPNQYFYIRDDITSTKVRFACCQQGSGGATSTSNSGGTTPYPLSVSDRSDRAWYASNAVNFAEPGSVYFKIKNGDARFRVGITYKYIITFFE